MKRSRKQSLTIGRLENNNKKKVPGTIRALVVLLLAAHKWTA